MKTLNKVVVPLVIVALGAIGFTVLAAMKQPAEQKPKLNAPPVVDVHRVEVQPYQIAIESQGVSEPLNRTQLTASVSGIVLSYNPAFNAGGMVVAGDVLVEIEKLDYLSALKTAEANLARAKADYEEEKARAKVAANDWAREGRSNTAPRLGLRKPQLAREKANVLSAEAELEKAKRNLERTTIIAPYNAIVGQRDIDIGQSVAVGSSLGEIMPTDIAEIRLPVSLDDYYRLNLDDTPANSVTLSVQVDKQTHTWSGTIVRDEGVITTNNRMLHVVAQVSDPYGLNSEQAHSLRFGSFLQAKLQGKTLQGVSKIPKSSLVRDEYVFVVGSDSTLRKIPVSIVGEEGQYVYVSSALNSGDEVIKTLTQQALPGMKVTTTSRAEPVDVQ